MEKVLTIVQMVSAVLLIIVILLQQKGAGLGGLFGGTDDVYRSKRGIEKVLLKATIVLSVIFLGTGIVILFS